jgi:hypothetical protein
LTTPDCNNYISILNCVKQKFNVLWQRKNQSRSWESPTPGSLICAVLELLYISKQPHFPQYKMKAFMLSTVAHAYNFSHFKGRDRKVEIQGQPGQKCLATLYLKEQARGGGTCL